MMLNEQINRIKTLMSINENITNSVNVDLTSDYFKQRIPFLKTFNDFSTPTHINLQKMVNNGHVTIKLGNDFTTLNQFNTSSEFHYSIDQMGENRYRITISVKNQFWTTPPKYESKNNQLEYFVLLQALKRMEQKLSYTYDEIKPQPKLSTEELNKVINDVNGCFFKFEDYVDNELKVDIQNPLDETQNK